MSLSKPQTPTTLCCRRSSDYTRFELILQDIPCISAVQKNIIRNRYLDILKDFENRSKRYSKYYFVGHFVITVGSLIVPALLSIQYSDTSTILHGQSAQIQIYWVTWIISLLVTTFNGILTLFKIDKKYFFLNTTYERLKSEGWQYFQLTGRYSGQLINHKEEPSHENQFIYFCYFIEKIKLKQVEEEYYKPEDKSQTPGNNNQQKNQEVYVPSINKPLRALAAGGNIPSPVKDVLNSIIISTETFNEDKEIRLSSKEDKEIRLSSKEEPTV